MLSSLFLLRCALSCCMFTNHSRDLLPEQHICRGARLYIHHWLFHLTSKFSLWAPSFLWVLLTKSSCWKEYYFPWNFTDGAWNNRIMLFEVQTEGPKILNISSLLLLTLPLVQSWHFRSRGGYYPMGILSPSLKIKGRTEMKPNFLFFLTSLVNLTKSVGLPSFALFTPPRWTLCANLIITVWIISKLLEYRLNTVPCGSFLHHTGRCIQCFSFQPA